MMNNKKALKCINIFLHILKKITPCENNPLNLNLNTILTANVKLLIQLDFLAFAIFKLIQFNTTKVFFIMRFVSSSDIFYRF